MRVSALSPVLALLVVLCGVAGACSSGSDVDTRATGSTSTETEAADEPSTPDPAVAAVCEPFARMVTAIKDAAFADPDRDAVAASIAPAMKRFASLVPELRRPPGLPASPWRGVRALAERILALPDRPSYAEIEAVEGQLTPAQRDGIEAAVDWFKTRCAF